MKLSSLPKWASLALLVLAVSVRADDVEDILVEDEPVSNALNDEQVVLTHIEFKPASIKAPFLEQFSSDWNTRWFPSKAKKVIDGVEDEALLAFRGQWAVESPAGLSHDENANGLVVKTPAAHHAISAAFKTPLNNDGKTLVVQYEAKFQNGLECGGAYLKLLTADKDFVPEKLSDKTPYTIMFGPDRCGSTNKIHFIFRHLNPITKEYEEKHLTTHPTGLVDKNTNLYTLIVKPDQSFEIRLNGDNINAGSLLNEFTPPVNPPKEIEDPSDSKPADWVDDAKIEDPNATKPDDWDEDAPFEIEDVDAVKPDDWLDDEPSLVSDPEGEKPEDWDDEEDGDWVAPQVPNPKCEAASGCGEWKRPLKKNPEYKGKWKAELIDNPEYKGVWKPKLIPNPGFFEDLNPAKFTPIGAIGFELWTMQDGILFDNIYVGHSVEDAKKLSDEYWKPKHKAETVVAAAESKKEESAKNDSKKKTLVEEIIEKILTFIQKVQINPVEAIQEDPITAGGLAAAILIPLFGVLIALSSASPSKPVKAKKEKDEDKEPEEKDATVVKNKVKKDGTPNKRKTTKKEKEDDE